jgi:hypothetical protein
VNKIIPLIFVILMYASLIILGCGKDAEEANPVGPVDPGAISFGVFTINQHGDTVSVNSLDELVIWCGTMTGYQWQVPASSYVVNRMSPLLLVVSDTSITAGVFRPIFIRVGSATAPLQELTSFRTDETGAYFHFQISFYNVVINAPLPDHLWFINFKHGSNPNTIYAGSLTDWRQRHSSVRWLAESQSVIKFQLRDVVDGLTAVDSLWVYSWNQAIGGPAIDSMMVNRVIIQDSTHFNWSVFINAIGHFEPYGDSLTVPIFPE